MGGGEKASSLNHDVIGGGINIFCLFIFQLRLSTLNATYTVLSPSVCDPNNPDFYNISLTRNGLVMEVVIRGAEQESPHQFPFSLTQELDLTLGSTAGKNFARDF